jgi:ABC-type phosphate transport system substrate-binding protein
MRRRTFIVTLAALAAPSWLRAGNDAYKVIVHPDSAVNSIDRGFLRRAYLKKSTEWRDGSVIHPVDLPRGAAARDRFTREVLKKSASQLRSYWNQQVFSGKAVPPHEADSVSAAVDYVLSNTGAVAYVPAGADIAGARIVELR